MAERRPLVVDADGTTRQLPLTDTLPAESPRVPYRILAATDTIVPGDNNSFLLTNPTGTTALSLNTASTLGVGWQAFIQNRGTAPVVFSNGSSHIIDGAIGSDYSIAPGEVIWLTAGLGGTSFKTVTVYKPPGIEAQAKTASFTLDISMAGQQVEAGSASAITATIPPFSSVPFLPNTIIFIMQTLAGVVTVALGSGVTLSPSTTKLKTSGAGSLIALRATATQNVWQVVGGIA